MLRCFCSSPLNKNVDDEAKRLTHAPLLLLILLLKQRRSLPIKNEFSRTRRKTSHPLTAHTRENSIMMQIITTTRIAVLFLLMMIRGLLCTAEEYGKGNVEVYVFSLLLTSCVLDIHTNSLVQVVIAHV